jgi:hypothetical protein
MTQRAIPVSDDFNVNWGPYIVYPQINELIPLDDKWVSSGGPAQFMVALSPLQNPCVSGSQTLLLHATQTGSPITASVILFQGYGSDLFTPVASWTMTPDPSGLFQPFVFPLSPEQIASITDYTNLHVQVTIPGPGSCATGQPYPAILYATLLSGPFCLCASLGGTIRLFWNGSAWVGTGAFGSCGDPVHPIQLTLTPPPDFAPCGEFRLSIAMPDNCSGSPMVTFPPGCEECVWWQYGAAWAGLGVCDCTYFPEHEGPAAFGIYITF